jgi:hypothetical protein
MTCDIVIRTYWRDFDWLVFSLRSIERYCRGFRRVIVIVPGSSVPWLRRHPPLPPFVQLRTCTDFSDDYLGQQVTKLNVDRESDAEFICHVDADCVFTREACPADLIIDGRPRIYVRRVSDLPRHWPWTAPTADFLGEMPTHDFMQCPPFVYPAWLYSKLREWTQRAKGVSLDEWVLSRPPRGFSEFNALGAFAYSCFPDRFIWIRADDIGEEERACHWFWSRERPDPAVVSNFEGAADAKAGRHQGG